MRLIAAIVLGVVVIAPASAQSIDEACLMPGVNAGNVEQAKSRRLSATGAQERRLSALGLLGCLGDPNPLIRDRIAFEVLSTWMRSDALEPSVLAEVTDRLLPRLTAPDANGFRRPFSALVLAEVARTDRIKPWMTSERRDAIVEAAAAYLAGIQDYRAFSDSEGFRHGVAHAADVAMQLALNPAVTKPQLDRLLAAIAAQVAPRQRVAYTAGESDRLARPVLFIAQRSLHGEAEWKTWFEGVLSPKPLTAWDEAFSSEAGIAKRHNTRAFLLSLYASVSSAESPGVRQLLAPVREGLKLLP
jgi:hypothetical protein